MISLWVGRGNYLTFVSTSGTQLLPTNLYDRLSNATDARKLSLFYMEVEFAWISVMVVQTQAASLRSREFETSAENREALHVAYTRGPF